MAFKMTGWSAFKQNDNDKDLSSENGEEKEPEVVEKSDSFLENLKKTNPEAYSTKSPDDPTDTLYYIKQDGKWVQTW